MVMQGESSPHKDLPISAKPDSGICFCVIGLPSGVFTCWVKMFGVPVFWLETVEVQVLAIEGMVRSFGHPRLWVTGRKTLRVGSPTATAALFLCGFWFHCFGGSRRGYLHPMQWWVFG